MIRNMRDEALRMLQGGGAILDTAREVTALLHDARADAAVIDGVAVVLHGHVRTTMDVDLFVPDKLDACGDALTKNGFTFDAARREFIKNEVPVHLVTSEHVKPVPTEFIELEGIRTVALADLIDMKLASGLHDPLRAQDLADVIGLIRHHKLPATFAARLDKSVRPEFRKLAKAIRIE